MRALNDRSFGIDDRSGLELVEWRQYIGSVIIIAVIALAMVFAGGWVMDVI